MTKYLTRWTTFWTIALLSFVLVRPAFAEARAVHTGEGRQSTYQNWMRWIPDSTPLNSLSLPGTHDTMSRFGGGIAKTQSLTLMEQLQAGIRALDIRARNVDDRFDIYHGIVYQKANFDEVLTTCNLFLALNPSETIIMWLSKEGDDVDCTRSFAGTYYWYRHQSGLGGRMYHPASHVAPLSELRGKIVVIAEFPCPNGGCGMTPSFIDQNRSPAVATAFDMPAKWEAIVSQAVRIDAGGSAIYENSTTGGASGVWPIDVANGLPGYEGMNYRYLKYLFTGNQRRTTGLFYMDFPGAGLIAAILAHNLKFTTNISMIGSDFGKIFLDLSFSATDNGTDGSRDHALQIQHFLRHILPNEHWTTLVSADINWAVSSDSEGLVSQTPHIEGFTHFATSARNLTATGNINEILAYLREKLPTLSGLPPARALGARNLLKTRFPHARWHVAVKQFPYDPSKWSAQVDAAIYAPISSFDVDDGATYLYTAWATSASNRPPVAVTSAPFEVNEGGEVTIKADDSHDPDGDALQYRWDFDGNGTWDTEYLPGPYIVHTFADNSDKSPSIEIFDGIASAVQKVGLTVRNVAPTFALPSHIPLDAGGRLTREFTIVDPGADTWRVSIGYGDGTPRVDLNLTNRTFAIDHQFPGNGFYEVRFEVRDDDDSQTVTTFRVVNAAPKLDIKRGVDSALYLTWTNHPAQFRLEAATRTTNFNWLPVSGTPTLLNGQNQIQLSLTNASAVFRLALP